MNGAFVSLVIVESLLTAAVILMFLYRGVLDMKEEDHIVLHDAESHLGREQDTIRYKAHALGRYIKVLSVAWSVLAVVILGIWVVQGLRLI